MVQAMNDNHPLDGVRVLVVEDDALMAMDLETILVQAGAVIVKVCRTLDQAMARADGDDFAVAVLDFSLGAETASPVARRLARRGVPFLFYTGASRKEPGLLEWKNCLILEKPTSPRTMVSAVIAVLSQGALRTEGRG